MNKDKIKLIAFDMDGTLTQHKSKLADKNRRLLDELSKKYKLLIVGAGTCSRIFSQLERYPVDIIGNYGMQQAVFMHDTGDIKIVKDIKLSCNRDSIEERVSAMRKKYGYTAFKGDNVEYHPSGCVTFPLLGTKAELKDKLSFDPDRSKRRKIYKDICKTFEDYIVFVGGSSSFDMAPAPYDKAYALSEYCKENNISKESVIYVGDDYGIGGNDEAVLLAGFNFIKIDDYNETAEKLAFLL